MNKSKSGFTIVELLIVIVVIAILAAITIVAYNGIQARAYQTAVQSDTASLKKRMEILRLDSNDGRYPVPNTVTNPGFNLSKDAYRTGTQWNLYYCLDTARTKYAVGAMTKDGVVYVTTYDGRQITKPSLGATVVCEEINENDSTNRISGAGHNGTSQQWLSWTDN